jgi:riboflavin synthase
MFTGIVEKTVLVVAVVDGPKFRRITIVSDWPDVGHGESIALNGVCLTIAELGQGVIGFDVIAETLAKSNLGLLQAGSRVNVERAMQVGDRIDGHFVQGHVDGTGRLVERIANESEWRLIVEPPAQMRKYLIPKGSVAIDGVSLTVAKLNPTTFEVALIPTTLNLTELGNVPLGWPFNIEADMLSKTIVGWLENQKEFITSAAGVVAGASGR